MAGQESRQAADCSGGTMGARGGGGSLLAIVIVNTPKKSMTV